MDEDTIEVEVRGADEGMLVDLFPEVEEFEPYAVVSPDADVPEGRRSTTTLSARSDDGPRGGAAVFAADTDVAERDIDALLGDPDGTADELFLPTDAAEADVDIEAVDSVTTVGPDDDLVVRVSEYGVTVDGRDRGQADGRGV